MSKESIVLLFSKLKFEDTNEIKNQLYSLKCETSELPEGLRPGVIHKENIVEVDIGSHPKFAAMIISYGDSKKIFDGLTKFLKQNEERVEPLILDTKVRLHFPVVAKLLKPSNIKTLKSVSGKLFLEIKKQCKELKKQQQLTPEIKELEEIKKQLSTNDDVPSSNKIEVANEEKIKKLSKKGECKLLSDPQPTTSKVSIENKEKKGSELKKRNLISPVNESSKTNEGKDQTVSNKKKIKPSLGPRRSLSKVSNNSKEKERKYYEESDTTASDESVVSLAESVAVDRISSRLTRAQRKAILKKTQSGQNESARKKGKRRNSDIHDEWTPKRIKQETISTPDSPEANDVFKILGTMKEELLLFESLLRTPKPEHYILSMMFHIRDYMKANNQLMSMLKLSGLVEKDSRLIPETDETKAAGRLGEIMLLEGIFPLLTDKYHAVIFKKARNDPATLLANLIKDTFPNHWVFGTTLTGIGNSTALGTILSYQFPLNRGKFKGKLIQGLGEKRLTALRDHVCRLCGLNKYDKELERKLTQKITKALTETRNKRENSGHTDKDIKPDIMKKEDFQFSDFLETETDRTESEDEEGEEEEEAQEPKKSEATEKDFRPISCKKIKSSKMVFDLKKADDRPKKSEERKSTGNAVVTIASQEKELKQQSNVVDLTVPDSYDLSQESDESGSWPWSEPTVPIKVEIESQKRSVNAESDLLYQGREHDNYFEKESNEPLEPEFQKSANTEETGSVSFKPAFIQPHSSKSVPTKSLLDVETDDSPFPCSQPIPGRRTLSKSFDLMKSSEADHYDDEGEKEDETLSNSFFSKEDTKMPLIHEDKTNEGEAAIETTLESELINPNYDPLGFLDEAEDGSRGEKDEKECLDEDFLGLKGDGDEEEEGVVGKKRMREDPLASEEEDEKKSQQEEEDPLAD